MLAVNTGNCILIVAPVGRQSLSAGSGNVAILPGFVVDARLRAMAPAPRL
jgi:hypothetical protein